MLRAWTHAGLALLAGVALFLVTAQGLFGAAAVPAHAFNMAVGTFSAIAVRFTFGRRPAAK